MAELRDTDQFLVNRNNTSGQIPTSKLMAELLSDDLMIVNREDVTYKITGQEVIDSISDIANPDINDILVDGVPPTQDGTIDDPVLLTPITVGERGGTGQTVEVITIQNQTEGKYLLFIDENTEENGDRFAQPVPKFDATGRIDTRLDYFDNPESTEEEIYAGLLKTGSVYFSWDVTQIVAIPPDISAVVLSENNPEGDRFTAESFTTVVTMAEEGLPVATKGIQGWVEGLLEAQATTDEIVELSQTTIINAGFVGFSDNPGFTKVLPDNQGEGWDGTFWAVYPYGFDSDPGGNYNYGAFNTMCRVTTPDLITGPATLQTFGYSTKSRRDEIGTSGYRHVLKTTGADILSDSREDVEDPTGDSNTGNAYHKFNFTIPAGVTVNEIEVYGSPNIRASIFGIGANGIGLSDTTSTTILTFASDKDIAQFGAGDTIQQNSEHTPVTSVITQFSADLGPTYSSTLTKSGGWSEPPSNAFDGSSSTAALTSDNNVWTFDASSYNLQLNSSGKVLEIEAGVGGAYSRGNWIINNINTGIEFNGGSRNRDLSAWCIDNNITTLQSISFVGSGDQITSLVCIKVNGEQLIDGEDQYTLTFQDDTDLENFRAGDDISPR